jgi:predicted polyphosphate/ATP-dependent NAD kinase
VSGSNFSQVSDRRLRIGLIINPLAGIGGPAALKGSDGVVDEARHRGSESRVEERVTVCLQALSHCRDRIEWVSMPGEMGADVLEHCGMACQTVGEIEPGMTTADDTRRGVKLMSEAGVDLLLFCGGDGTARDVVDVYRDIPSALGIPCGVKMHSGVFATTPLAAADLLAKVVAGEILSLQLGEVRDIDEESLRKGIINAQFYGELPVPDDVRYVQQTKIGGQEVEELVIEEIAAEVIEGLDADTLYLMGSGSTVAGVMQAMGLEGTLLGVDVVRDGEVVMLDATEVQLWDLANSTGEVQIIVTPIGGQGHVFGRGNQQFSPRVIRAVGQQNITIISSKSKLTGLDGRPLIVDTGDEQLDAGFSGMTEITTGYEEKVLYRIG